MQLYHIIYPEFLSVGNMEPSLEAGTGYTWFGKERSHTLNGGAGVNIPLSETGIY
jgi:hypothetical protein